MEVCHVVKIIMSNLGQELIAYDRAKAESKFLMISLGCNYFQGTDFALLGGIKYVRLMPCRRL